MSTGPADLAAEFRRSHLSSANHLGRLRLLGACYSYKLQRYHEPRLEQVHGEQAVNQALTRLHREEFRRWLARPILERRDELVQDIPQQDIPLAQLERAIPPGCAPEERDLFRSDLDILLCSFRRPSRAEGNFS